MTPGIFPNFDRVARIYDVFTTLFFWGAIQRCQYFHLPLLKGRRNILVIGGGTGKIIKAIRQYSNFDSMVYVDSSAKMIKRAQHFVKDNHAELEIEFHSADILNFTLPNEFDAIIMPFVADCFSNAQLDELGKKLNKALSPGGLLMLSDFYESDHSRFSHTLSRAITTPLYFVFGLLCNLDINRLPDFERLLRPMHLESSDEQTFFFDVLRSGVYTKASSSAQQLLPK